MLILLHDTRLLIILTKRNVFWDPAFHPILQGFNLLEDSNEVEFVLCPDSFASLSDHPLAGIFFHRNSLSSCHDIPPILS